ncbi:hypothetical protein QEG73_08245 [Chitinophagaceae bacterium 26-R-25]|nr:hypothetical protein [Chitinophagaceae bacterium 26-R-25]
MQLATSPELSGGLFVSILVPTGKYLSYEFVRWNWSLLSHPNLL